jgi:hypothetical protein
MPFPLLLRHALCATVFALSVTSVSPQTTVTRPLNDTFTFEALSDDEARTVLAMDPKARQWARDAAGTNLDGSLASLAVLERMLGDIHAAMPKQSSPATEERLQSMCLAYGIYLGEVFRRHVGGKWGRGTVGNAAPELAVQADGPNKVTLMPVRRVCDRIVEGKVKDVHQYFLAAAKSARAP